MLGQLLEVFLLLIELLAQLQQLLPLTLADGVVLVGLLAFLEGVTIFGLLAFFLYSFFFSFRFFNFDFETSDMCLNIR